MSLVYEKRNNQDSQDTLSIDFESELADSDSVARSYGNRFSVGRKLARRGKVFLLRSKGFSGHSARKWAYLSDVAKDSRKRSSSDSSADTFTRSEIKQAISWGFMPETIRYWGINKNNREAFVSEWDVLYLHPMNGKYDKWVRDRISALNIFKAYCSYFERTYFHIIRRDGAPFFITLTPEAYNFSSNEMGLHSFLMKHGSMTLSRTNWSERYQWDIQATDHGFSIDGIEVSHEQFRQWLDVLSRLYTLAIIEKQTLDCWQHVFSGECSVLLKVRLLNEDGLNPFVCQSLIEVRRLENTEFNDAVFNEGVCEDSEELIRQLARRKPVQKVEYYSEVSETGQISEFKIKTDEGINSFSLEGITEKEIPQWERINKTLIAMCQQIPQVEFLEFEICIDDHNFKITGINPLPSFDGVIPFSSSLADFIHKRVEAKKTEYTGKNIRFKRFRHNGALKIRRLFASAIALKGLVPYQSVRWIHDMGADLFSKNGLRLSQKIWGYRHGFLSFRISQYGITKANWQNYISDFEYRWLRHINSKYKYWLEDKITLKYIASDFSECFPDYYYFTSLKDGENRVIPLMDLPAGFEASYSGIIALVKKKKTLALKPDEGSHGEGFYKLTWDGESFALNDAIASEEAVISVLQNPANQYLVTEYIDMHPQLKRIYPESVNTIRVTVFKEDGRTPEIGNAYMRIGSSRTGFVDNVAAGGVVAAVDIESGRFGNAKILDGINQGNLIDCPIHPDTSVEIRGVIPNWEYAKEKILQIAAAIPQLEYFGFDLAITPDGIKLPEINRFPDFPRIDTLTPEIIRYLLYKLKQKKRVYGYDKKPSHKILHLPRRTSDLKGGQS